MVKSWVAVVPVALAAVTTLAAPVQAAVARCRADQLTVALGPVDAGAGQRYASLVVTGRLGVRCQLSGYASHLGFEDADGAALATDARRVSVEHGAVTVTPASAASFDLHWSGIDAGDGPGEDPAALAFRLPGSDRTSTVAWTGGTVFQQGFLEQKPVAPAG